MKEVEEGWVQGRLFIKDIVGSLGIAVESAAKTSTIIKVRAESLREFIDRHELAFGAVK
jgi:hypothetical protein